MMHGTSNIKFIDAKQAIDTYKYKNTKRKTKWRINHLLVASCWIIRTTEA